MVKIHRVKHGSFSLLWERNGAIIASEHEYNGRCDQQRFTRRGWIIRCICAGKKNGFTYLGMAKRREGVAK